MRIAGVFFAVALLMSCTNGADRPESTRQLGTTTTEVQETVVVQVRLPRIDGALVGPANGHVLDETGETVASFEFESGWILPERWGDGASASRSGASPVLDVQLPAAGRYTFVLDEYAVSNNPCGTCEQGFAGGEIESEVVDGSDIELPSGDATWVS